VREPNIQNTTIKHQNIPRYKLQQRCSLRKQCKLDIILFFIGICWIINS